MNTVRTTARLEHSQPFAARCAFGTRNPLRRQRVIGGEGIGGRLETLAACATGIALNRADRPSHMRRDDCGFENEAAFLFQRTNGDGLDH